MKAAFEFNVGKVWEFVESRPFYSTEFYPQWNTAKEIYEKYISHNPEMLRKYTDFLWSGNNTLPIQEQMVLESRENYNRLSSFMEKEDLPTYLDFKYASSSKIFETEEVMGSTPEQLQAAEKAYSYIVERLEAGEELDEGFLGALAGGAIGALAGPAVGRAICKVLGIDEKGHLGKLLTSRLVAAALGYTIGK
jgi:hypothetical protein